ncbi:hypothetical protein M3B42_20830, partial [Sphingobacterium hotanense]|nr:hypothetical protein [Sphingobacterium hotanense]
TLARNSGNTTATTTMTYTYENSNKSNRLKSLSGNSNNYSYDGNGNAITDRMATTFSYNQLNLPKTASRPGTSVSYQYDALGAKLKKLATVNGVSTERDYIGGIEYNKNGAAARLLER